MKLVEYFPTLGYCRMAFTHVSIHVLLGPLVILDCLSPIFAGIYKRYFSFLPAEEW